MVLRFTVAYLVACRIIYSPCFMGQFIHSGCGYRCGDGCRDFWVRHDV